MIPDSPCGYTSTICQTNNQDNSYYIGNVEESTLVSVENEDHDYEINFPAYTYQGYPRASRIKIKCGGSEPVLNSVNEVILTDRRGSVYEFSFTTLCGAEV